MGYPTDSTHLSDLDVELMIDEYGGKVESQFARSSFMREFVEVRPVRGTDTIVNNRVGRTTLRAVVPGVRPDASKTAFGSVSLTVSSLIIARDNRSALNEFQTHFSARMELAMDHGKEIGKLFDQAFIIQAIKGAYASAPSGLNGALGAGKNVMLDASGDEDDADKLEAAIASVLVQMDEEDIPLEELVILVRPTTYRTLVKSNKLISRDYSAGNGDYAAGIVQELNGVRIVKTSRIPTSAITGHVMSSTANSNAYDVSETEALSVAVILHPKSLLAGETIPLTSDIWYNKEELQWFIDSFLSFDVTINRPDCCGVVSKYHA